MPRALFRYWLRFAVGIGVELPLYAARRRRLGLALRCLVSWAAYIAAVGAALRLRPVAALWTLLVPYLLSSCLLMLGNWCAA